MGEKRYQTINATFTPDRWKQIGERIKKERKNAGLSQSSLMESINRPAGMYKEVGKWEKGAVYPSLTDIIAMCNLFNCDIGYLLCEYDCKTWVTTDIHAATGLSEHSIYELKHLSGLFPSVGHRFLNTLFDAGFGHILSYWQAAFYSYVQAKRKEAAALGNDEGLTTRYKMKLNTLDPAPHETEPGYNMRIGADGYLDMRLRQIGEQFNVIMKVIAKAAYKNEYKDSTELYEEVIGTYNRTVEVFNDGNT
jgi:transcriptional regulator with XRE-family HTH domain